MTDTIVKVIKYEPTIVKLRAEGTQGPPGPQGPQGAPGGSISEDEGNAIMFGSDGGIYCAAIVRGTSDW